MENIKYFIKNSDIFGVISCFLCLIHCISAPLILISSSFIISEYSILYSWWKNLDYLFITISFFMVYFSAQLTKVKIMKYLFWFSWVFLFVLIINEKTESIEFSEYITYLAAILLSSLHFYNLRVYK